MRTLFPQTLEAALGTEKSFWRLGDALLAETDEDGAGKRSLRAASEELAQYGLEYSVGSLGLYRNTAAAFPRARRNHSIAWSCYSLAANPDALDAVVRVAKKSGEKVTADYVKSALSEMREQAHLARERARDEAKREQEEAREAQQTARKAISKARGQAEEDRARKAEKDADRRRNEADEKLKQTKVAPKRSFVAPPSDDDIPVLVLATSLKANADKAVDLASKSKRMLGSNVAELSPRAIAGLTKSALEAANAWREFADAVRSAAKNKRGHLSVVNE